jgi:hypothetical protein
MKLLKPDITCNSAIQFQSSFSESADYNLAAANATGLFIFHEDFA